jgi:tetratricopeptide (TPR) repeat protein
MAAVVLVLAVVLAYANSLLGPFLFDDLSAILRNASIRQMWPPWGALAPPTDSAGVVGRPMVNLSLAFNYALGGADPFGYHFGNLIIHALATLALFGFVHRTLGLPRAREVVLRTRIRRGPGAGSSDAVMIAFCIALLWSVHPLLTESVTFVIQRTESLAGLFYLLTLYCFVRAIVEPPRRRRWQWAAVASCLAGMATKEVMATLPLVTFLFDVVFVSGSARVAWRERGGVHLALAATWALLAVLMMTSAQRGGTVGFGLGVSSWEYLLTQCRALVLYFGLSIWPDPLVVDYGAAVERRFSDVAPQFILLGTLAVLVIRAARRQPALGFSAAWVLIILAPSSSFVPLTTQTIAEHRMYLPLVAIMGLIVVTLYHGLGARGLLAVPAAAIALGMGTAQRNEEYASAVRLWSDTVFHRPDNPRAHYNLANALMAANRPKEATRHYEAALRLNPAYSAAHYNLAGALLQLERVAEAVTHYEAALRLEPGSADLHANLAAALIRMGRMPEAISHYDKASRLGLLAADEQLRFGRALAEVGRLDEALVRLNEALRLNPKHAETQVVMGMVLSAAGRGPEALLHFTAAVAADPNDAGARAALGDALIESGKPAEALLHYETALRLQPGQAAVLHTSIGNALIRLGRVADAIRHYENALQLNPDDAEAKKNLSTIRAAAQRRGLLNN